MKKLETLQTRRQTWHNVELYGTAQEATAQGFALMYYDERGSVYGIRSTDPDSPHTFKRVAFVPDPVNLQWYLARAEEADQITHIAETVNAGPIAITNTGATRWTGWDGLQDIADGNMLICPECGERHNRDDYTESENEDGETVYTCPSCGATVNDFDDLDALTLSEYLADNFGIEYRIDDAGDLRSVQIMTACGGPNIYIDTERRAVCLHWWGSSAAFPIDCADDVEDVAREWWEGLRA